MKIEKTTNYGMFKRLKGNRPINESNLGALIISMKENFLIKPIDVNENFEIIDGEHRKEASKQLGLPVYYVVHKGWGLKEAQILNSTQKKWSLEEFLESYILLDKKEYIDFKNFINEYQFNFTVSHALLEGTNSRLGGKAIKKFKDGLFKIKDLDSSQRNAEKLLMIKPFYAGYDRSSFIWAILKSIEVSEFDFSDFLSKLRYQSAKLNDCTTTKQYLMLIEEIYNYKRKDKIRLF